MGQNEIKLRDYSTRTGRGCSEFRLTAETIAITALRSDSGTSLQ